MLRTLLLTTTTTTTTTASPTKTTQPSSLQPTTATTTTTSSTTTPKDFIRNFVVDLLNVSSSSRQPFCDTKRYGDKLVWREGPPTTPLPNTTAAAAAGSENGEGGGEALTTEERLLREKRSKQQVRITWFWMGDFPEVFGWGGGYGVATLNMPDFQ